VLLKRRFAALVKAAKRCVAFLDERGGGVLPPVFKSKHDEGEYALMSFFLNERAAPFLQFWEKAIDTVEAGTELTIRPGDIPMWFDEPIGCA
jgi:hypothetical protein